MNRITLRIEAPGLAEDRLLDAFAEQGITVDASDTPAATAHVRVVELAHGDRSANDGWELRVDDAAAPEVELAVRGPRSARYAVDDVAGRLAEGSLHPGVQRCGPAVAVRGVIEGFYGPPWSPAERLEMVAFAARQRFNTFMYAPKDDRFLREAWREPHRGTERDELERFLAACASHDIDAMVGVSPGLSMAYSDRADRQRLAEKVISIVDLGAARIALLFDDIAPRLQHPADLDVFDNLADAHAVVANEIGDVLADRAVGLVVCPTVYSGTGEEPYIARLGAQLAAPIDLFHTGRAICSPAITAQEAVVVTRSTLRAPLYWDNYPVNDLSMAADLHIGPYRGRDPLLARFSAGVMANAMQYAHASKIPLATIGDFLWDPDGYDPEASWRRAIRDAVGTDLAASFYEFADCARRSCLCDDDPWQLSRDLADFAFAIDYGDAEAGRARLAMRAREMRRAERALRTMPAALLAEVEPWLDTFSVGCDAVALIADSRTSADAVDASRSGSACELRARLTNSSHQLFGDVLNMALDELCTDPLDGGQHPSPSKGAT